MAMAPPPHHPEAADFARIRHDLRTPVNHILGYAEMLLEDEGTPSEFRDDLRRIHTGGRHLLALIKDYFDDEHYAHKRPDTHQMYHELRTPVNHIVGYTELLIELAQDHDHPHMEPDLLKIRQAAGAWLLSIETYLLAPECRLDPASPPPPAATAVRSPLAPLQESAGTTLRGSLLVVDDDAGNRDMLARRLTRLGHRVCAVASGEEALDLLRAQPFDAVLLDLVMPGLDGYQVLTRLKADASLAEVRVIMLSALDQDDRVARCIEAGADDFIAKPFSSVFLRARLGACLEKKALRDRERQYLAVIQEERAKSDKLLLNVLPPSIADRLKGGESLIADHFKHATVLFADLVGFTALSRQREPLALVSLLNDIFCRFDDLAAALGLEKIKTIGDAYMVVAGVPVPRDDHAPAAATLALRMRTALQQLNAEHSLDLHLRTGLHSGPLAAGIIGRDKFAYDVWGDAVNTASRMESSAPLDAIHISAATAALLGDAFDMEPRGPISVKGLGSMETWILNGAARR
jgi:class 3 adenylate cyclase